MNDLISKTEALIKIRGCYPSLPIFKKNRKTWQEEYEGYIKAYEIIQDLPTVEPKTGHWIRNYNGTWSCDQCNSWIPDEQHYYARFCLYCGAKMERSKE